MSKIIVVGAGIGGCHAIRKLLELNPYLEIILIEAGGDIPTDKPLGPAFYQTQFDWQFPVSLRVHHRDQEGRVYDSPQKKSFFKYRMGKGIGGSTITNGAVAVRPGIRDLEKFGIFGRKLKDRFHALENCRLPKRGKRGPVHITQQTTAMNPLSQKVLAAFKNKKFAITPDINGTIPGFGYTQLTAADDGSRKTVFEVLITPLINSGYNIAVLTHTQVDQLCFDEEGRCVGVSCVHAGEKKIITADHVIVAAGAIATPQILNLSGIGKAEDLNALGIQCRANLPVGGELIDHPILYRSVQIQSEVADEIRHIQQQRGITFSSMDLNAFFDESGQPNRENAALQIQTFMCLEGWASVIPRNTYVVAAILLHPKSKGSLKIESTAMTDAPKIEIDVLSDSQDAALFELAQKKIDEIIAALPSDSFISPTHKTVRQLTRERRENLFMDLHPCNTCPVNQVVDCDGQVMGVSGLSIADASILPTVSGNPQIAVRLVAEKIAQHVAGLIMELAQYPNISF